MYGKLTRGDPNISGIWIIRTNEMQFRVLPVGTVSLRYSELVCQVTLRCVLRVDFSGIFFLSDCKCVWRFFENCIGPHSLEHPAIVWLKKMVVVSHHPYSPDLTPCDFLFTHGWSRFWNGGVVLTLQRFSENHWRPLTAFLFKVSENVFSNGSISGIAASIHRGSTLKETKVSNLFEYFK
jgi:hypothetical protein